MSAGRRERNSSVELLRIIACIGVIILHYNLEEVGNALAYVQQNSVNHYYLLFSEALFMCAVNVTIIISAYYLSATQERRFIKVVELILQLTVFRMAFYLASALTGGQELTADLVFRNLLPKNYYVVLYCTLYIISPYINLACSKLSQSGFKRLIITLFLLFSVWTYIVDFLELFYGSYTTQLSTVGMYGSQEGYTIVNFVLLYVLGAYMRLCKVELSSRKSLTAVLVCFVILFSGALVQQWYFGEINIWQYSSPFMIAYSALVFLFFKSLRFSSTAVNELAGAVFTCFLFHTFLVERLNVEYAASGSLLLLICHQLGTAAAIFLISYVVYKIYGLCSSWFIKLITPMCNKVELSVRNTD